MAMPCSCRGSDRSSATRLDRSLAVVRDADGLACLPSVRRRAACPFTGRGATRVREEWLSEPDRFLVPPTCDECPRRPQLEDHHADRARCPPDVVRGRLLLGAIDRDWGTARVHSRLIPDRCSGGCITGGRQSECQRHDPVGQAFDRECQPLLRRGPGPPRDLLRNSRICSSRLNLRSCRSTRRGWVLLIAPSRARARPSAANRTRPDLSIASAWRIHMLTYSTSTMMSATASVIPDAFADLPGMCSASSRAEPIARSTSDA